MRLARIIAATITSLALAVPLASTVSTASAHETAPKQHRVFKDTKIVNLTRTKLQMRTHILRYSHGFTYLEKKQCKVGCKWHRVNHARTNKYGRVRYPVQAPSHGRWYWRIGTPPTHKYARSYSPVWYTRTTH